MSLMRRDLAARRAAGLGAVSVDGGRRRWIAGVGCLAMVAVGPVVVAGPAQAATLTPTGTTVSVSPPPAPNVFIADSSNNRVVKVPAGGGAQTIIGSGLQYPDGVAVDAAGDVFIADSGHNRVVEVPAGGGAQTIIGSGLNAPQGVAVDAAGDVFIADTSNNRVVEVPAGGGTQTTIGPLLNFPGGGGGGGGRTGGGLTLWGVGVVDGHGANLAFGRHADRYGHLHPGIDHAGDRATFGVLTGHGHAGDDRVGGGLGPHHRHLQR